jgi:hypothetical protein
MNVEFQNRRWLINIMSTAVAMKQTNHQTSIARQRLCEHIPVATNTLATIEVLLGYNDGNDVFCWVRPEAI